MIGATLAAMRAWLLVLFLPLAALRCTKPTSSAAAPVATCTKANDQCQYADGKIGLCTPSSMECDGGSQCLVCMSLH